MSKKKRPKEGIVPENESENDKIEDNQTESTDTETEVGAEPATEEAAISDELEEVSESAGESSEGESDSLQETLETERNRYIRLYAEYENFRKRSKKERESVYTDVRADTILRFLPIYDNLARALAQDAPDDVHRKGLEMMMAQMKDSLEKLGVTEIPAVGERFDPELHNAVMHMEDPGKEDGEIVEEFEKGFILGDRVIRFSMVVVAN